MKIYTKSGDDGFTGLYGGSRLPKSHLRIESYGQIDELNSYIGWLADNEVNASRIFVLREIQDRLFTIGSILASSPDKKALKTPDLHESDVVFLENEIDQMQENLEPLKFFILPGGNSTVSFGHIARTVCRRAERHIVILHEAEPVLPLILSYINRLSDYLFVLCRTMAKDLYAEEIPWKPRIS